MQSKVHAKLKIRFDSQININNYQLYNGRLTFKLK